MLLRGTWGECYPEGCHKGVLETVWKTPLRVKGDKAKNCWKPCLGFMTVRKGGKEFSLKKKSFITGE